MDTEFTNLERPALLSLGMVSIDGAEHYCELDLDSEEGQRSALDSSAFVRAEVRPQWGKVPGAGDTLRGMAMRTVDWLDRLRGSTKALLVAYDFHADFDLLGDLLSRSPSGWSKWADVLVPTHIGYLLGIPEYNKAACEGLNTISGRGLRKHHALADAFSLKERYLRAHEA